MTAPASLSLLHGDQRHPLIQAGGSLPAEVRVVLGTTQAGQRELAFDLVEGEDQKVALLRFELPPGLPANTWIPVFFSLSESARVSAEARENLRRLRVPGRFTPSEGPSSYTF